MKIKNTKRFVLLIALLLLSISLIGTSFAAEDPVSISNNGSRLVAKHQGTSSSYQWKISDEIDGTYNNISGATSKYYDITAGNEGKYIKVSVNGTESQPVGPIGKLVVMDIGKGAITLGVNYSGKNSDGVSVSGKHSASNIYVIVQKNRTRTPNNINFSGHLPNDPFDVTLAGVYMGVDPTNHNQSPGASGSNTPGNGKISIPAGSTEVKKVTLRLRDENILLNITYYNGGDTNTPQTVLSSLKITDINGDGEVEGGSLYIPVKLAPEEIDAFVAKKTNYNHWNAGIGGLDGSSLVQNLHIAGGKIQVITTLGDNCTAIGAGGNGYCQMEISGGEVIAHCNGTGAAIGGGIGWNAKGGRSNVLISGGKIYAKNHAKLESEGNTVGGVAIGSGSSFKEIGTEGEVTITGGIVEAYGTFGNGIGGGNSSASTGGSADITISGGTVIATSIGGGNSKKGTGGSAEVTVSGNANVTLLNGIGGGLGESGSGGDATITVDGGTMYCGGIIGGGDGNAGGNGGKATIIVSDGTLTAKAVGGGTGGVNGNGGAAEIYISGGTIKTGSIGGGSTQNTVNGKLGYAKAEISGGDISGQFLMAAGGTEACSFTMTGGKLHGVDTSNTSEFVYDQLDGAAVYMDDPDGIVSISGGTIEDCHSRNGGAVYMTAGNFMLSGTGVITKCYATNGGAIYMTAGNFTQSGDGVITDCHATENGGGVYLGGGNMIVSSGQLTQNTAQNGGAAYVNASTDSDGVFVSGGEISNNTATINGGAISVNNGFYKMTGGSVESNHATIGSGGGIYVAANGIDVLVDIRSGLVGSNKAGTSGGAVAVVGQKNGTEIITVNIGVNEPHFDSEGNALNCDHAYTDDNGEVYSCPELINNHATLNGGCVYITGGSKTMLNAYCLVEEGSSAADGKAKSNFMMVEGGTVVISTADGNTKEGGDAHGKITINNTIHVYAGDMSLYGSMTNPEIFAPITVDITAERGSYADYRIESNAYYKLQYFENFTNPDTGVPTGQYTVYQIKHGDSHKILSSIYLHEGYTIDGWWTSEFGDVAGSIQYMVNEPYTFTNESVEKPGNLTLYAKWLPVGYYVYFDVGTTGSYRGEMEKVRYNYDTENTLPENEFFRPGWIFTGWDYEGNDDGLLEDQAMVKNLTSERGITLVAIWSICDHQESFFSYSKSGNSLIRTCSCEQCTQTATVIAEDTVYVDGNKDRYDADIRVVTNVQNEKLPGDWSPTPTYTGKKHDNDAAPDNFLIDAGLYSVSITGGEETIKVNFEIKKAKRAAPAKPLYKSSETDQNVDEGIIIILNPNDPLEDLLEYKIVWHDDNSDANQATARFNEAISTGFNLTTNYTNYYVYARYDKDDNHEASEWIKADSVLFYVGNVYIFINSETGIEYSTTSEEEKRGLIINVSPSDSDKYYLFDTKVTVTDITEGYEKPTILSRELRKEYYLEDIPNSTSTPINIHISITGVKKKVQMSSYITEDEVFGAIEGAEAVITRDSAYTMYFEIENYAVYTDPKLIFSTRLPVNTTLILMDKTSGYPSFWSYEVDSSTYEVSLESFVRMGTENSPFIAPYVAPDADLESAIDVLKYQVIVDFADSNEWSATELTSTFSADLSDVNRNNGAPDFPASALVTQLKAVATSAVTINDLNDTMQKSLKIEYLKLEDGVVASKWKDRCGALILTPLYALPEDARIEVVDNSGTKTTYYRQSNNQFIISLVGKKNDNLRLNLLSDLFPNEYKEYSFRAEMISSCSSAGLAPSNGTEVHPSQELTFVKAAKAAEPSLKIYGDRKLYNVGETVKVNVTSLNCPEHTVLVLRLLSKDIEDSLTSNVYFDTGWKQKDDTVNGENFVPLGQNVTGSCCIVVELRDINGNVITSAPYYFVVCE